MFSRSRYNAYSCDSRLPQYSLPRSVSIRSMGTPYSSKNGRTRSLSMSAAVSAFLLGKSGLAVGVDKGLLIDPPDALQIAHVVGILRAQIPRVFRFDLAVRFFLQLGLLQRTHLIFGQDDAFLCHFR